MKKLLQLASFMVLTLLGATSTHAQTLIGSEFSGNPIFEIDGTTGIGVSIGGGTTARLPGLAYNPNTDTLYGTDQNNLYIVNPSDGTTALVGPHGPQDVTGLTFNSGFTSLYSLGNNGQLYSIDPTTGAQTAIGPLGVSPADIVDLATDSTGTVYAAGIDSNLYTVNTTTGVATSLGAITGTGGIGLTAIAFAADDTLFAIDTSTDRLMTVDVVTRVATDVGGPGIGGDIRGLAVLGGGLGSATAVPTLSTPGLIAIGLVLGITGLLSVKRRRRA